MNILKQITFIVCLFTLSFSQWWFPEMEISPTNPTQEDIITVRLFGDTPSNVVSTSTELIVVDNIIYLNTIVNLGPLAVIGAFESINEIGPLNSGSYFINANVGYGASDGYGNFDIFNEQIISLDVFISNNIEECEDLGNVDFGLCDMALGISLVNGECQSLSGCGWEVNGIDYSDQFFQSYDECNQNCNCPEDWVYCFVDPCLVTNCPAYPDAYCVADYCGGCYADFFVDGEEVNCESIGGCTDSMALNYDENAIFNDGSCDYACEEPNPAGCFQTGCGENEQCVDFGNSNVPGFCVSSGCFCDENYGWFCTEDCNGGTCISLSGEPGELCGGGQPGMYDCDGVCSDYEAIQSWIGNGYCDIGWGEGLNCPEFDCDGGDCGLEVVNGTCQEINWNCGNGDYNDDGQINILDIVGSVNIILVNTLPTDWELCQLDVNEDGAINILDIVQIVQWILNPIPESIRIDMGTSFGECWGYCIFQLVIENGEANFVAYNWWDNLSFPDLSVNETYSSSEWNNVLNNININDFFELDEEYGCPDCADGGAEWIELTINGNTHKVTFEAYTEVEGIEEIILILRELRGQYWEQVSP